MSNFTILANIFSQKTPNLAGFGLIIVRAVWFRIQCKRVCTRLYQSTNGLTSNYWIVREFDARSVKLQRQRRVSHEFTARWGGGSAGINYDTPFMPEPSFQPAGPLDDGWREGGWGYELSIPHPSCQPAVPLVDGWEGGYQLQLSIPQPTY